MDNHYSRAIILVLLDRLTDNERQRLHFYLGNDVPRRIRDDLSLSGTLSLLEYLFDQNKINERDFTFLIKAFDAIHCISPAELLREYMRRMQSNGLNQSIQSSASKMAPTIDEIFLDQGEDKYAVQNLLLINKRNSCDGDKSMMIDTNNKDINPMTIIVNDQPTRSKRKHLLSVSSMTPRYLLLFVLLSSIIAFGMMCFSIERTFRIRALKKNQSAQTIQRLTDRVNYCQQAQQSFGKTYDGMWVEAKDGKIPPNAVDGGREGNRRTYVVRFFTREGDLIPGKLVETKKEAVIAYHGVRDSRIYQVLTNSDPKLQYKWVKTSSTIVPEGAVIAGWEGGNKLYVGRFHHTSGSILLGKHIVPHGAFFYLNGEKEELVHDEFEVLCVS